MKRGKHPCEYHWHILLSGKHSEAPDIVVFINELSPSMANRHDCPIIMPAIQYNGRANNKAKNVVHSHEGVRLLETDGAARLMVAYIRDLTLGHALSNRFLYCNIGCLLKPIVSHPNVLQDSVFCNSYWMAGPLVLNDRLIGTEWRAHWYWMTGP